MDLTVLIATYNRAAILGEAIEGVLAQRLPPGVRWELVVVDNNSHDDTKAVVEHYIRTSAVPVRYLFEGRQGKSHALNAGLKRADGDVIAFTDDDVLVSPEWVATALRVMDRSGADGAGGRILPKWMTPPPAWLANSARLPELLGSGGGCDAAGAFVPVERSRMGRGRQHGVPPERLQRNWRIRRGAWAVRQATGQFRRPRYGRKGTRRGLKIVYDPDLVVYHRVSVERMRKKYFRRWAFTVRLWRWRCAPCLHGDTMSCWGDRSGCTDAQRELSRSGVLLPCSGGRTRWIWGWISSRPPGPSGGTRRLRGGCNGAKNPRATFERGSSNSARGSVSAWAGRRPLILLWFFSAVVFGVDARGAIVD